MRCLLQLLLLIALGSHALQGCVAHHHCDTSQSSLNHRHCSGDSESEHSHGPVHPCDSCECGNSCCVWMINVVRAELPPTPTASDQRPLLQHDLSGRRLAATLPRGPKSKPHSLQSRNCVWLI